MKLLGKRPLRSFLIIVILICGCAGLGWAWVKMTVSRAVEHSASDEIITIEQGSSLNSIAKELADAGIVRHPTALQLYLRATGRGANLKAGDYKFQSPISPIDAIDKIRRGEVFVERFTIPEGYNRFEIAETLASKTAKAAPEEFLSLMDDQKPIAKIAPAAHDLEGYLFPDTYNFNSKTTPEELVRAMVARFEEVFVPEWKARADKLGLTVHQVVTLASIIEKEAKIPEERPHMASVFFNRLKIGMPLGSDPTFIYAAKLAGDYDGNPNQPRYRESSSPYNTYKVIGLPPGPIASPGRASLEAVLFPDKTDDLYFVLNDAIGHHKFSRTAAEHESAVEEYKRLRRNGGL